jgi:hypothetical protein
MPLSVRPKISGQKISHPVTAHSPMRADGIDHSTLYVL